MSKNDEYRALLERFRKAKAVTGRCRDGLQAVREYDAARFALAEYVSRNIIKTGKVAA